MDTLNAMRMFRRVVEMGSFSAVARESGVSQPSVSKQVSSLEKRLNIRLLNRNTRHQALTDVGREYYEHCVRILDDIDEIESGISVTPEQPRGTLHLSAPISYGLHEIAPLVKGFMQEYPELGVDLILDDHDADLIKEGIDLSIRMGPLRDSSMVARALGSAPRYTVASPTYLQEHGEPRTLAELERHECIVFTLFPTRNEWYYKQGKDVRSISVSGKVSVNNSDAMCELTKAGLGIAVMPFFLIQDALDKGLLVKVMDNFQPTPVEINALYPARRLVPRKVKCFIDYYLSHRTEM